MNAEIKEEELTRWYSKEVLSRMAKQERVAMSLTLDEALSVISFLQLAFRHPAAVGSVADQVRRITSAMIEKVGTTPAVAEACRRGWIREYDE